MDLTHKLLDNWNFVNHCCEILANAAIVTASLLGLAIEPIQEVIICTAVFGAIHLLWYGSICFSKIDDGEWILPKYMIKSPFLENVTLLEEYPCVRAQATRTYEASQLTFSARYRDHDLEKMLSLGHTRMLQHGTEEFMHLKCREDQTPVVF